MTLHLYLMSLLWAAGSSFIYHPSDSESKIGFKIKNFGVTVNGSFKGLEGTVLFDSNKPEDCNVSLSVMANTVDTGIKLRDNHLKKEEYLDVTRYSELSFISKRIAKQEGKWMAIGTLTIKNINKEVSFPFEVSRLNDEIMFKGEFMINRRDFKVGGNSFSLADDLVVHFELLAR
jgi:polyisoprenoid-binding protein YceI